MTDKHLKGLIRITCYIAIAVSIVILVLEIVSTKAFIERINGLEQKKISQEFVEK